MTFPYWPDDGEIRAYIEQYIHDNQMYTLVEDSIVFKSVAVEDD